MSSERWNELADIKEELAARDWFPGTSGNLSIKVSSDPLTFLVTASGKDKRKRTDEDFLLVNELGLAVEETHLKPSAETLLHTEIYQNTDAGCSLHIHTLDNNLISDLYGDQGFITFKGQELIKAFGIWDEGGEITLPIIKNYAEIPKLAKELANQITPHIKGVLIRNHGITVWGRTGFEAKKHLEAFEFLCSFHLRQLQYKHLIKGGIGNGNVTFS
ncbi:methylthioribulose-1-phosphate dehydratase [Alkalihalobacillus alcalophilus ATCC 27647 = CGMCC 1.3604]|uniref:Methylthioribulose-1-phosphate dehydratase n=1 Tax=Alkalihalobacillus alcalophilus ATCC 27647 = CGMCC 1.3604 TaxID=1218173 RepID=A0A094YQG6_ALKAL|nr:methylthioribulose 1-phosphate dehydratase [Alkalihalobacillus alcalophilus]KGA95702.1 methylthioribulose-1-phosphate dehydratase [Alkalihalobacillus alcalophilus ATCC 27647 = CGMCC 1.3604]MED1564127.1 methylthioribulose 1-phosphate dehydratase [Alkalihalobacillus alcalophilus]THG90588.1 methylthioribulose-1-phosphate dehydratase [Alkalihalobacillus alcalophilus ATCC 27647 = CGMCC 1.3604]